MSSERILVVGPSWVGDMVMAQSLFIELQRRFEDCEIDVHAPAWSLPVIARMPQIIDGVDSGVAHGVLVTSYGEINIRDPSFCHDHSSPRLLHGSPAFRSEPDSVVRCASGF